jgi:ribosomal protein S18 acetylase RimI-like enzyme
MAIEVREARPDEYEAAGRVVALAYRDFVDPDESDWLEYLERIADVATRARVARIVVAVEDGRVVGSATVEVDARVEEDDPPLAPDEVTVRMLGVHPDARRRGVARAMLDEAEAIARRAGRSRITLGTAARMRPAQSMYEHLGFRRLPDRVFPDGFVLLEYERRLAPER